MILGRWCACSIHEQWGKWNRILFKIILSSHTENCSCSCVFCDNECNTIERLSPRYLMAHLLCPAALQFALSSVPLYKWDCINNRYVSVLFSCHARCFQIHLYFPYPVRCADDNCFSKKRGSLFACPRNNFFSDQGSIEYEVWETLDVTEQMWDNREQLGRPMQSLPAAARRVKQWVKKRTTKAAFISLYLSKLPSFFLHHQIEQVFAHRFKIVSLRWALVCLFLSVYFWYTGSTWHLQDLFSHDSTS